METPFCQNCQRNMSLQQRNKKTRKTEQKVWRCKHREVSVRNHSFFSKSHLTLSDIFMVVSHYLECLSLWRLALKCNISHQNRALTWTSYIREVMKNFVEDSMKTMKIRGHIEIDESAFGHRNKYHRGAQRGNQVWVFGMVERDSNRLILYPVEQRSADTLIPIIKRHVEEGSIIFSDSWAAYVSLNDENYNHYTVCHTTSFQQVYKNTITGERIDVNTNMIEGAWFHAKKHVQKIHVCRLTTFEGHLAEIIWRNHHL